MGCNTENKFDVWAEGAEAHGVEYPIRVNHVGYLPAAPKFCMAVKPSQRTFYIQRGDTDVRWHTVFKGQWQPAKSGSSLMVGDFSSITESGDYRILLNADGADEAYMPNWHPSIQSYHFQIREGVYDLAERILFGYVVFQRCGSDLGWAGKCHMDPVPLLDACGNTVKMIDASGGYHQSNDLRSWHDGISMSMYALLRYAELRHPCWDKGDVSAEIRRGCDYFLKVLAPEGYVYDAQFAPIGWGPRHYYVVPATLGAQCNVAMLFARASVYFRKDDSVYADRLIAAAKRLWVQIEGNPFFETFQPAPEKDLPLGAQPAEKCYRRQFRTSAAGLSERAAAALELSRVTGDKDLGEKAQKLAREYLKAFEQEGDGAFVDWGYCFGISGLRLKIELLKTFGTDEWRKSVADWAEKTVRELDERDMNPVNRSWGVSSTACARNAIQLTEAAELLGRPDYKPYAQRSLDWIFGANPWNASYVEGVGQNQWQRPVFGQFFPSTPQIPGGVLHASFGEYDMPPTMMTLWACAVLH